MNKLKIGVSLDHAKALAAYLAAGHRFPAIPPGKNTIWHHFVMEDGKQALILNQRGFAPQAADNEEQVNGCSLAVVLEDVTTQEAMAALEAWVKELLEV